MRKSVKVLLWVALIGFVLGLGGFAAQAAEVVVKKEYVDTEWGQVHYRYTKGDPAGPVMVMLHQVTDDSEMYEKVMKLIGDKYSLIVAPDFPGYGGSFQATDEQVTGISFYADVFKQALDNLGIKKAHIVGHHTGGCIALDMKCRWPDFFPSLTIIGPIYGDQKFREDLRKICTEQTADLVPVRDGSHLLKGWKLVQNYGAGNVPLEMHQRTAMTTIIGWKTTQQGFDAALNQDFISLFDKVPAPIMIMSSIQDVLWPFFVPSKLARPDAEAVVVAGHDYECDEDPQEVARYILDFTMRHNK